jgi:acetyl-CoA carboxylase biotin carboxyl carrier protein
LNGKKANRKAPAAGGAEAGSPMDVSLLEQLVQLMAENDLNTVDVRDGQKRIILKRGQPAAVMMPVGSAAAPAGLPVNAPAAAQPAAVGGGAAPASSNDDDAKLVPIKSPMVGTFYSKPNPESKPFVTVGSVVSEETDVCTIEAMKHFNTIQAGCRGTIARILVQDGEVVDFGRPLFLVKPS